MIINNNIIEGKLSKILSSEVCIKLVALALIGTHEVGLSFKKVGDPCFKVFIQ